MKRNWKTWIKAAIIRAIKTFAESAIAYIGTGALVLKDVDWLAVLSAGAFGMVTSLLFSLKGLPEVDDETVVGEERTEPPERDVDDKVVNSIE